MQPFQRSLSSLQGDARLCTEMRAERATAPGCTGSWLWSTRCCRAAGTPGDAIWRCSVEARIGEASDNVIFFWFTSTFYAESHWSCRFGPFTITMHLVFLSRVATFNCCRNVCLRGCILWVAVLLFKGQVKKYFIQVLTVGNEGSIFYSLLTSTTSPRHISEHWRS